MSLLTTAHTVGVFHIIYCVIPQVLKDVNSLYARLYNIQIVDSD